MTSLQNETFNSKERNTKITKDLVTENTTIVSTEDTFIDKTTQENKTNDIYSNIQPLLLDNDSNEKNTRAICEDRISKLNYNIVKVEGDGRCFFRSIVVCRNENLHHIFRDNNGKILDENLCLFEKKSRWSKK